MSKTTYLKGEEAQKVCNEILNSDNYQECHLGAQGYWKEHDKYVAFDNTTGDCWMEEFTIEREARKFMV